MIDLFYKSYSPDFEWLYYSLESVKKFVTGYNRVIIVIPESEVPLFDYESTKGMECTVIPVKEYGNGYLFQQVVKLQTYKYTDAEYILYMDSDCIFTGPVDVNSLLVGGRPQVLYTPYSSMVNEAYGGDPSCWREPTSKFIGKDQQFEFMRRHPFMYRRSTLKHIAAAHDNLEEVVMNSESFSEFNAIGAWAFEYEREYYRFVNTDECELPEPIVLQQHFTIPRKERLKTIHSILGYHTTDENFLVVERDTHIGKWVQEKGRLDFDQSALRTYLPYFKKDGVLINVGANIGAYAYAFKDLAKKIYCFEPNPEAFKCLKYNLGSLPNVILSRKAVSDGQAPYTIVVNNDNIGMAYTEEGDGNHYTLNLDALPFTQVDFILMDCEGFELKVLKGAEKIINHFQPVMVLEINDATLQRTGDTREDIFQWLTKHKYTFRNIHSHKDLSGSQLDIICFPKPFKDMKIDLTQLPAYLMTCNKPDHLERRRKTALQLIETLGFSSVEVIVGPIRTPYASGAREAILSLMTKINSPFIIFEDDATVTEFYAPVLDVPEDCDVLFLGGIPVGNRYYSSNEEGVIVNNWPDMKNTKIGLYSGQISYKEYDSEFVRILNMYSAHAVVFLTERGKNQYLRYVHSYPLLPHDVAFSYGMATINTYMVRNPFFYQEDIYNSVRTKQVIYEQTRTEPIYEVALPDTVQSTTESREDSIKEVVPQPAKRKAEPKKAEQISLSSKQKIDPPIRKSRKRK